MSPIAMPDHELIVIQYLQTLALPVGTTIGTDWPLNYDGSQTHIKVEQTNSSRDHTARSTWIEHPFIEVRCISTSRGTARTLSTIVCGGMAVIWSATHPLGIVSDSETLFGPMWVSDSKYAPAGSFLSQWRLLVHPNP